MMQNKFAVLQNLVIGVLAPLTMLGSCVFAPPMQTPEPTPTASTPTPTTVPPGVAVLTGNATDTGYDFDGKGGYEYLQVNVEVNVGEAGTYVFIATLLTADGETIAFGDLREGSGITHAAWISTADLSMGTQYVPIYFKGGGIRKIDIDGPYITTVELYDAKGALLDEARFVTEAYDHRKFEDW